MHACVCHFFVVSLQPFYKLTLMPKRNIILFFLLGLFASVVQAQSPVLCMDGTLLFREDFGGNDPNDPDVSMASVPGMSSQYYNSGNSLGSGHYTIRKEGWQNGIQWHRQDDHTYPDDKTRGYLLEIDGVGGSEPFYSKTIEGLCEGSKLTFSAYVVNVHYAGQIYPYLSERGYVYPRLKFVLKDPNTGAVLASQSTGDIMPDMRYATPETWKEARDNKWSAEWQLVGMNFTVPPGVESIQMFIYNDVERNGSGNDFALDDIEIHLCLPPVTITGEEEVCPGSAASLTANFTNDGTLAEPLEYKWWFSTDSLTWTELSGSIGQNLTFDAVQKADSGWYKVAVSSAGNIESVNCRALSEPFRLSVKDCPSPEPELCMDGVLLFREDFGGNDPNELRVGQDPVNGMTYNQLLDDYFGIMRSGSYLLTKQGYCNGDTSVNNLPQNRGSQWHLQDDHTYPNDITRGYLLEIDGRGDNAVFYAKTINGLCTGSKLTFSAYVANVMTWGQYVGRPGYYSYPRLKFVLRNSATTEVLATYDTGEIPFDSAYINNYQAWQFSSQWRLAGMNFTVPEGVETITLTISNNTTGYVGNDFAIDDVEIRLCMPSPAIVSENTACLDSVYEFAVNFTNDGTLAEPLEYKWWHSEDSLVWTELPGFIGPNPTIDAVHKADSGWYKVAVSGAGNIESVNCRAQSAPFRLNVQACAPPPCPRPSLHGFSISADRKVLFAPGNLQYNAAMGSHLCADGTYQQGTWRFAEHQWDYIGDNNQYVSDTYNGWIDLFAWGTSGWNSGANIYQPWSASVSESDQDFYVGGSPFISLIGAYRYADWAVYNTIGNNAPNTWRTLTYEEWNYILETRTNASNLCGRATINGVYGIVFLPDDYPLSNSSLPNFLPGEDYKDYPTNTYSINEWQQLESFGAVFLPAAGELYEAHNYYGGGIIGPYHSTSSYSQHIGYIWTLDYPYQLKMYNAPRWVGFSVRPVWEVPDNYIPTVKVDTIVCDTLIPILWRGHEWQHDGVIRDTLQSVCGADSICLQLSLTTKICCPDISIINRDTTVCDTLMPFTWHGLLFSEPGSQTTTLQDERDCDTLQTTWTLNTRTCCPDIQTITRDTTVCDTLLPFTWIINERTFVFEQAETQEISIPHSKWEKCTGTIYTLRLDTVHCERLYDIIVNKYNWVLLCNNTRVRTLFPQRTVIGYQWYKDGTAIIGATEDDYSEQNELQGDFQLRLRMDDGSYVWSEILTIQPALTQAPSRIRIYRHNGHLIYQAEGENTVPSLPRGLYIIQIEQNGEQRIEKKLIP